MPESFNYKPSADQMTHSAISSPTWSKRTTCCAARPPPSRLPLSRQVKARTRRSGRRAQGLRDFCSDALAKMDDKTEETTEEFGGKQVTLDAWLSLVLASARADHYAEAAMYLRLNGVLPPTAKK